MGLTTDETRLRAGPPPPPAPTPTVPPPPTLSVPPRVPAVRITAPTPLAPPRVRTQALSDVLREPTPESPVAFGKFQLLRRIGAGGMGEVFLAREDSPHGPRACVVKKVLPNLIENRAFVGRFLDESRVVVRLKHPNIARVYAMGEVEGEYYLAMEYVQGKTVSRFTKRLRDKKEQLPLGLILLLGEKICAGLQYAHDARDDAGESLQLVHRDLSPANVCVSYRGDVKIIDFGASQSTLKEEMTAPRIVIGNLTYMAPEQAKKQAVDRRADVYATGVVLWELLAWFALPQKGDPIERWRKAANPTWDPPSKHHPGLPADVDAIVLKALKRDPEERFANATLLGEALHKARLRHAPDASERDLGDLLARAFEREKAQEDAVLAGAIQGKSIDAPPSDRTRRVQLVPPTALAFEHTATLAPAGYVPKQKQAPKPPASPEEITDPGIPPVQATADEGTPTPARAPPPSRPPVVDHNDLTPHDAREPEMDPEPEPDAGQVNATRTSFGVTFAGVNEPRIEPSLIREIEADHDAPSDELPDVTDAGFHQDEDTRPFTPRRRSKPLLLGAGVFLMACAAGFLAVYLLSQL